MQNKHKGKIKKQKKGRRRGGPGLVEGVIKIDSREVGHVFDERSDREITIEPDFLGTAIDGDTVQVSMHASQGKDLHGEIIGIVSRKRRQMVGTLDKDEKSGVCFVVPDDRRVHVDILIPPSEIKRLGQKLKPNEKVVVELEPWTDSRKNPEGKIIEVLGKKGDHETEIAAILYDKGFVYGFSSASEREAEAIERRFPKTLEQEIGRRRDIRGTQTFTIDPETAKDFDDALSFKQIDSNTLEIGVHIADVSFFVPPNSHIDEEARDRATSVYLVDRTTPMLPAALSENICSLRPNEDRLAYSTIFEIKKDGTVTKTWIGRTVIKSDKRFTYKEAQEVLDNKGTPENKKYSEALNELNRLAKIFYKQRVKKGSILFEKDEIEIKLDKNFKPVDIKIKPQYQTMSMIEEWMLLANRMVAEEMSRAIKKREIPGFVYRNHDAPNQEKIESLAIYLKGLGYTLEHRGGNVTHASLNKLFKQIEGKPVEHVIKFAVLRSMSKAIYSTQNIGHFGLAFDHYTHFTSPIRRYPDVMVHRLTRMKRRKKKISKQLINEYEGLCRHSSDKEREAERAERDSVKYKQIEYMADHIGKTFTGIITNVVSWGMYVQEDTTLTDGLVKISSLGDDYYELDEKNYRIVGTKSKKEFHIGDKVKIKVTAVDKENRNIDYKII